MKIKDLYDSFFDENGDLNLTTIDGSVDFEGWTGSAPLLNNTYIWSEPIGSRIATCIYNKHTKLFKTGCFSGRKNELLNALEKTHKDNEVYKNEYLNFILKVENELKK